MRIKKLVAMLLVVSMVFMSAGCSNGGSDSTTEVEKNISESISTEGSEDEPVSFTFAAHFADLKESNAALYNIIDTFNRQHEGQIVVNYSGSADKSVHITAMKLAAESGSLPDVFFLPTTNAVEFYEAGYLYDMTDMIEQYGDLDEDTLNSLYESKDLQDNSIYGLPLTALVTGFWYNKDVFDRYGVAYPDEGTTFDELLTMIDTFKANGVTTIINGAKTNYSVWAFLLAFARYGFFEHDKAIAAGSDVWSNDDFIKYFEKIQQLQEAGAFAENNSVTDFFQAKELFLAGEAAMFDSGAWDSAVVSDALGEKAGFWWGPIFEDSNYNQQYLMQAPSVSVRVNAESVKEPEKLEAITEFMKFYMSPEADQIRVDNGTVPLTSVDVDASNVNAAFAKMLEALKIEGWISVPYQADANLSEVVQEALYDSMFGVICGIYTPEEALEIMDEVQTRALEE